MRFKYFIRGGISDTNIAVGRINFIEHYGWTRVAIINQQEELFIYNSYLVEQILSTSNIDYRTATFDTTRNSGIAYTITDGKCTTQDYVMLSMDRGNQSGV